MQGLDHSQDSTNVGGSSSKRPSNNEDFMHKELDLSFLQNFYFSPSLSLHQMGSSFTEGTSKIPPFSIDEPLIPLDKLVRMVNPQYGSGADGIGSPKMESLSCSFPTPPPNITTVTHTLVQVPSDVKDGSECKRLLVKPKASSAPCKKAKKDQELSCPTSDFLTTVKVVAGVTQPRQEL